MQKKFTPYTSSNLRDQSSELSASLSVRSEPKAYISLPHFRRLLSSVLTHTSFLSIKSHSRNSYHVQYPGRQFRRRPPTLHHHRREAWRAGHWARQSSRAARCPLLPLPSQPGIHRILRRRRQ